MHGISTPSIHYTSSSSSKSALDFKVVNCDADLSMHVSREASSVKIDEVRVTKNVQLSVSECSLQNVGVRMLLLDNIQDSVDMPSDQNLDEFVESMVMSSCLDTVSVNPLIGTSMLRIDNLLDEGTSRDDLIGFNTELSYIRPSIAPFVIPEADNLEVGSPKVAQRVV